jgi:hypothetical protein
VPETANRAPRRTWRSRARSSARSARRTSPTATPSMAPRSIATTAPAACVVPCRSALRGTESSSSTGRRCTSSYRTEARRRACSWRRSGTARRASWRCCRPTYSHGTGCPWCTGCTRGSSCRTSD